MEKQNQYTTLSNFINDYSMMLKNSAPKNSGALAASIEGKSQYSDGNFNIEIFANIYAAFQDQGINGTSVSHGSPYTFKKKPPISSLENFAKHIGVSPYALQNSIYKKGIKPKMFISNSIDSNLNDFADNFITAIWDDFFEDNKTPEKK